MNLIEQARHVPHGISVISQWLGDGGAVVGVDEAQARANICLSCPNNVSAVVVTKAVALAVKQFLGVKNHLKLRVAGERSLGRCSICSCVLRLQVWEPQEKVKAELTAEEIELLPKPCWKRL